MVDVIAILLPTVSAVCAIPLLQWIVNEAVDEQADRPEWFGWFLVVSLVALTGVMFMLGWAVSK